MGSLAIARLDDESAARSAALSAAWDRALRADAELVVAVPSDAALVLGAFQRKRDVADADARVASRGSAPHVDETLVVRRGSGGAAAYVEPGVVWVQLALARPDALVPCTADKLLNRYVRPLLRALTASAGAPASYFGRDWIAVRHRPVALVAFAHDASRGRALFEAIVGVRAPFSGPGRASFLGKDPSTLEAIAGRAIAPRALAEAIVEAYGALAHEVSTCTPDVPPVADLADEPPWSATREEAIGAIAAGRDRDGRMRVGGELMASRDAIARLEAELAALPADTDDEDLGRIVDAALATGGAFVFGVRSLTSICDVIASARAFTDRAMIFSRRGSP